jgi:hypothetical protein
MIAEGFPHLRLTAPPCSPRVPLDQQRYDLIAQRFVLDVAPAGDATEERPLRDRTLLEPCPETTAGQVSGILPNATATFVAARSWSVLLLRMVATRP